MKDFSTEALTALTRETASIGDMNSVPHLLQLEDPADRKRAYDAAWLTMNTTPGCNFSGAVYINVALVRAGRPTLQEEFYATRV